MSPAIHKQFAEQTQQTLSYEAIEVRSEVFDKTIADFFEAGGKGVNCTVPLKELAFNKADALTQRAEISGAVNTLKCEKDGSLLGDNTDGVGLITDLTQNLGLTLKGKRVLVLGAGGAARGILGPLLDSQPSELWLANRTVSKAKLMQNVFEPLGLIHPSSYKNLTGEQFDLVINATSASLTGELPDIPSGILSPKSVCYDLAYSKEPTAFTLWGEKEGAVLSIDGLGMLVEQAAHAFNLWRGVMPDTSSLRARLRS